MSARPPLRDRRELAARLGRPALVTDPWDPDAPVRIRSWLDSLDIRTLGVGGPSEGTVPGIGDQVYSVLVQVLTPER